jgi:hypothetical protein
MNNDTPYYETEEYREGQRARLNVRSLTGNPYTKGSRAFRLWLSGWTSQNDQLLLQRIEQNVQQAKDEECQQEIDHHLIRHEPVFRILERLGIDPWELKSLLDDLPGDRYHNYRRTLP